MRRRSLTGTLSHLCCYNHFSGVSSTTVHSDIQNCYILDLFHSIPITNFVPVFTNRLDHRIYKSKFPTCISFPIPFPIFYFSYHFKFSIDAPNLALFVTVAMLLFYQSPVNSRGSKVGDNFLHKVSHQ